MRGRGFTRGLGPVWGDALRLAFGTLTAIPVPAPHRADKARAGWAMTFAPVIGVVLAGILVAVAEALGAGGKSLLVGFVLIGLLALLTRGMHLDGLADTADGLGATKGLLADPARALEVMRRGDVGPFGVVSLVMVLGVQAVSLGQLLAVGRGAAALVLALVASRFLLSVLCMRGVPAARTEGLGPLVASSVGAFQVLGSLVISVVGLVLLGWLILFDHAQHLLATGPTLAAAGSGVAIGVGFALHCIRRFGGITGDVLGACVEVAFTTVLLVSALLA